MSPVAACPACGARYRGVPDTAAGTSYTCRRCRQAFTVVIEAPAGGVPATRFDGEVERSAPEEPPATRPAPVEETVPPPTRVDGEPPATLIDGEGGEEATATKVDAGASSIRAAAEPPATKVDADASSIRAAAEPPETAVLAAAKEAPPDLWAPGEVILGLYEVVGVLGRGGMGAVYRVRHLGWNIDLAVKSPLAKVLEIAGGARAFVREAETWVNLGLHPHVVSAFYVRTVEGVPRVFAEFVDGRSLQQAVRSGELTDLGTILDIAIQMAWGLHYSHECGVIHQDVKPGNVLIAGDGVVKITDFGLARAGAVLGPGPLTAAGDTASVLVTAGGMTPAYCSPEQDRGEALSRRSDLWSWAVSLLEVFVGRVTWKSGLVAPSVLTRYLDEVPQERRRVTLPEAVVDLLRRCFRADPGERPATLAAVADELVDLFPDLTGEEYRRRRPTAGRDTADSLNNRAVSLLDLGREDEAVALWRKALERKAHHVEATYNSVVHAWKHGLMSDQEVLLRMQELRRTETATGRDEHLLGKIYLALAEYGEALKLFDAALRREGEDGELVRDRSLAECGLATTTGSPEQWQVARKSLETAADLGRTDPFIVSAYAAAVARSGDRESAARIYEAARERVRDLPAELDDGLATFVPRSEVVREWQPFTESLAGVAITRGGDRVVAVGDGHRVILWNPATGESLASLADARRRATAVAVLADGRTVATGCEQEPVQLWDLKRGTRVAALQPHQGTLTCLATSASDEWLVGGASDRRVRVWEVATRALRLELEGHDGAVTAVAAATEIAVSASLDGSVRVWRLEDGACLRVLAGHGAPVRSVALAEDRELVLFGCDDGVMRLWCLRRGEVVRVLKGHARAVTAVAFAAAGRRALSASVDGSLRLWELDTGVPAVVTRFDSGLSTMVVGGDGRLAVAAVGRSLCLIRPFVRRPYQLPYAVSAPVSAMEAVERAGSHDQAVAEARGLIRERRFAEAVTALERARSVPGFERAEESLRLWRWLVQRYPRQGLSAAWETRCETFPEGAVSALALEPGGTRLALGLANGRVLVAEVSGPWDPVGVGAHDQLVSSLAWLPDGGGVLSSSWDGTVVRWSLDEGGRATVARGHGGYVHQVALVAGPAWVSVGDDGSLRLWPEEAPETCRVLEAHATGLRGCAASPDGRLLLVVGDDDTIALVDVESGGVLVVLEDRGSPTAVVFTPDGSGAVSAARDGSVSLWDLVHGRRVRHLGEATSEVTALAVSPDGGFAVSGHRGGELELWALYPGRVAAPAGDDDEGASPSLRTFEGHSGPVHAVAFSADGHHLVSAGSDGSVRWWCLDWRPEVRPEQGWSDRARPFVEQLLVRVGDARRRRGETAQLTAADRQALLGDLARRGLGWLTAEGVEAELRAIAGTWRGETSATRSIRDAERPRLPRTWRRGRRRRLSPLAVLAVTAVVVVGGVVAAVVGTRDVGFAAARVAAARAAALEARSPLFSAERAGQCRADDHELYLAWALDPREADEVAVSCLAATADEVAITTLVDRLRRQARAAADEPGAAVDLPPRPFVVVTGEESTWTNASELVRLRRLLLTVLSVAPPEVTESAVYYLGDGDREIRATVARGLALGGHPEAVAAVLELASGAEEGRAAVAAALPEVVTSGQLSGRAALALVADLAGDPDPTIRRSAASALTLFDARRARNLARRLAADPDPEVATAAERALGGG